MNRSWILAQREPRISRAKIVQTIIVVAFLVPTFWQLNDWENCNNASSNSRFAGFTEPARECKQYNSVIFHSMIGAMYFLCVM